MMLLILNWRKVLNGSRINKILFLQTLTLPGPVLEATGNHTQDQDLAHHGHILGHHMAVGHPTPPDHGAVPIHPGQILAQAGPDLGHTAGRGHILIHPDLCLRGQGPGHLLLGRHQFPAGAGRPVFLTGVALQARENAPFHTSANRRQVQHLRLPAVTKTMKMALPPGVVVKFSHPQLTKTGLKALKIAVAQAGRNGIHQRPLQNGWKIMNPMKLLSILSLMTMFMKLLMGQETQQLVGRRIWTFVMIIKDATSLQD